MPAETAIKLAKFFNVSVDYLLGNEKTSPTESAEDETLEELLERLKNREEMKMLFKLADGATKEDALVKVIRKYIKYSKPVRFDGNGYSDEWRREAMRRGLDCEVSAPLNFDRFLDPQTVAMFSSMGVYNEVELEARAEIKREMYVKKIQIEARVLGDIAMNHIVPIASKYEGVLLEKAWKLQQLGMNWATDKSLIENIQTRISKIQTLVAEMIECRKKANRIENMREKAIAYHDTVAVFFDTIREEIDRLEEVVDDQIWTLPKYREILFIK